MDKRVKQLIDALKAQPSSSISQLAQRLDVGERAVRNYIHRANEELEGIVRIEGAHGIYTLAVLDAAALASRLSDRRSRQGLPATPEERISYLLNDLLMRSSWITIDEYARTLYVSERSISTDLRSVEQRLKGFGLSLEKRPRYGIRVQGPESNRRLCLASFAEKSFDATGVSELSDRLRRISQCVNKSLEERAVQISAVSQQNLIMHLYVALKRIEQGCYVPMSPDDIQRLRESGEWSAASLLARSIEESFGVHLPDEEVGFIAVHLLGRQNLSRCRESVVISDEIWSIVTEILAAVNDEFCFDFASDLELQMNLACHIVPLAYRLVYRMSMDNPLLSDIKRRFPLAYSMAALSSAILQRHFESKPSDEELGYLAMFFALALERQKSAPARKRILIVCASGRGSAQMLEYQYGKQFGDYIESITTCDVSRVAEMDYSQIDYVFTTVPLERALPVPVREVGFFLERRDADVVRRTLSNEALPIEASRRFFSEELFFPHVDARTKDAALDYLCARAIRSGRVGEGFAREVAIREEASATSFGNGIAMPHGMHPLSDEAFVTVGILDQPILWDEYGHEVSAVFLVSFARSGGDQARKLTALLAEAFMDESGLARFVASRSWDDLMRLVESHSA